MEAIPWIIHASGAYPLWRAWQSHRNTSLTHALAWAAVAWAGWALALADGGRAARYLGLCLIGAAGVAVLGARRPGVAAWDFVVGGLLAVLLLSLAEGFLTGAGVQLGAVRATFLAGTLGLACGNYLPTKMAPAALLLAVASGLTLAGLATRDDRYAVFVNVTMVSVPWLAWACARRRRNVGEVDALWLGFRDAYGFVWGQRLRDQFDRAAEHAGLSAELGWSGLRGRQGNLDAATEAASLTILQALMKRFGPVKEGA